MTTFDLTTTTQDPTRRPAPVAGRPRRWARRLAALAGAAATFVAAGCGWSNGPTGRVALTTMGPIEATGPIDVDSRNGGFRIVIDETVEVLTVDAEIAARASTQEAADARAAATVVSIEPQDDGTLLVQPEFPGGWRDGDSASLVLRVPGPTAVDAQTTNGSIEVVGPFGPIRATSSNGRVTLKDTLGDAWVVTSNGRVVVSGHLGEVTARTSNGSVNISLHDDAAGPVVARTSNGSMRLSVGPAFAGELKCSTSNGSMNVDGFTNATFVEMNKNRLRLQVPTADGGTPEGTMPVSEARTSNGSVSIERRS